MLKLFATLSATLKRFI